MSRPYGGSRRIGTAGIRSRGAPTFLANSCGPAYPHANRVTTEAADQTEHAEFAGSPARTTEPSQMSPRRVVDPNTSSIAVADRKTAIRQSQSAFNPSQHLVLLALDVTDHDGGLTGNQPLLTSRPCRSDVFDDAHAHAVSDLRGLGKWRTIQREQIPRRRPATKRRKIPRFIMTERLFKLFM